MAIRRVLSPDSTISSDMTMVVLWGHSTLRTKIRSVH